MHPELDAVLGPVYFAIFAVIALLCALGVAFFRHPIQGVVSLVGVMLALSGIYALLRSPFVAVLQVLVYAGAIMMLLVFVIMVLNQAKDDRVPRSDALGLATCVLPAALLLLVGRTLSGQVTTNLVEHPDAGRAGLAEIAKAMFTTAPGGNGWYLLFEVGGLLLLAAIVGAVVLAKRRLDAPEAVEAPAAAGHGHGAAAAGGGHP